MLPVIPRIIFFPFIREIKLVELFKDRTDDFLKKKTMTWLSSRRNPGSVHLAEQVVLVFPVVDLVFQEFLRSQQRRIWHPLIGLRNFDLLLVFVYFLQVVRMAGKLLELVVQLFLERYVDLVGPLGYDRDGLVKISCLAFDLVEVLGLHDIGCIGANLSS